MRAYAPTGDNPLQELTYLGEVTRLLGNIPAMPLHDAHFGGFFMSGGRDTLYRNREAFLEALKGECTQATFYPSAAQLKNIWKALGERDPEADL